MGPGTVLTAAIQSGMIPIIDLREIFRQAQQSQIVTAAHAIQQGQMPALDLIPIESLNVTPAPHQEPQSPLYFQTDPCVHYLEKSWQMSE